MDAELSDRTPEEIVAHILNTVPSGAAEAEVGEAVGDGGAADDLEFNEERFGRSVRTARPQAARSGD